MPDVALVTSSEFPQLSSDDQLLLAGLVERGLDAVPAVWDDPGVDWSSFRVCVLRSTWDYHLRLGEFLAWVERAAGLSRLVNPVDTVVWNTRKFYLRDVEKRGVPIVPTVWLEKGSRPDLTELLSVRSWEQAVIKPVVSASAHETLLISRRSVNRGQAHIERLIDQVDLMVQPFILSVRDYGERSLMFIDGEFTHAVRRPAVLDSADAEHSHPSVSPTDYEMDLAIQALAAAGQDYLYSRVDIVRDDTGQPMLMELELVEPSLFFAQAPGAAERMARAIVRMVDDIVSGDSY